MLKIASKFAKSFGEVHVKWVRYARGTLKRVAVQLRNLLQTWTDATHASDPDCRKYISDITIKLAGNLLCGKQIAVDCELAGCCTWAVCCDMAVEGVSVGCSGAGCCAMAVDCALAVCTGAVGCSRAVVIRHKS